MTQAKKGKSAEHAAAPQEGEKPVEQAATPQEGEKAETETANAATEPAKAETELAKAETELAKAETEPSKVFPGLRIQSRVAGFWRAGRAWQTTPVDIPASAFSAEQIAQLRAEPMLIVADIDIAE